VKKVLILIKGLGRGGAEQLLLNAAPYLDRSRFEYEIAYMLPQKDALVSELEKIDLRVTCLEGARGIGWIGRLRRLVRDHSIDLVHAHSPLVAIAARLALRKKRVRFVYTEHNVWESYHPATFWGNLLTYPRNDHVFTVSDHVRDSIRFPRPVRFLKSPPVETLYHGPDPADVSEWAAGDGIRRSLGVPEDAPLIGTVANFKPHKGHQHLLEAALEVRRHIPDARFVLVGHGPLEPDVRQQVHELGLDETVIFAGYRDDAPSVAGACDLFVLASLHEGLSIGLLEAMALGTPAVVTDVGGLPEAIDHGQEGLLVPPGDPQALADGIVKVLGDSALHVKLADKARLRAAKFDIRKAVPRTEQVYSDLLK
jgi:glycosyltransferase involved in cell wall biosynthesis